MHHMGSLHDDDQEKSLVVASTEHNAGSPTLPASRFSCLVAGQHPRWVHLKPVAGGKNL